MIIQGPSVKSAIYFEGRVETKTKKTVVCKTIWHFLWLAVLLCARLQKTPTVVSSKFSRSGQDQMNLLALRNQRCYCLEK